MKKTTSLYHVSGVLQVSPPNAHKRFPTCHTNPIGRLSLVSNARSRDSVFCLTVLRKCHDVRFNSNLEFTAARRRCLTVSACSSNATKPSGTASLKRNVGLLWSRYSMCIPTHQNPMRLIIEARLADGDSDFVNDSDGFLAVVERRDCSLAEVELMLVEGRSLGKMHWAAPHRADTDQRTDLAVQP
jgi:hypothetical protein